MIRTGFYAALVLLPSVAVADGFPKLDTPQKAIDAFVQSIDTHSKANMAYSTSPPQTGTDFWPDSIISARIVSQKEMTWGDLDHDTGVYAQRGDLAVVVDHTYLEPDDCGRGECPKHETHFISTYHLTENDGQWAVVTSDTLFFPEGELPLETALEYTQALKDVGEQSFLLPRPEGSVSYRMMVFFVRGSTAHDIIRLDYDGKKASLFTKLWDGKKAVYRTNQRDLSDADYKHFLAMLDEASTWEQGKWDTTPIDKRGIDVYADGLEVVFEMDSHSEYKLIDRWDSGWLMDDENKDFIRTGAHAQFQLRLYKFLHYFYGFKN